MRRSCAFLCLYLLTLDFATPLLAQAPDTDPPVIRILVGASEMVDGSRYKQAVTPVIDVTDASALQGPVVTKLDGIDFPAGSTVSADGQYTLSVTAKDVEANTANRTVGFEIDTTPPQIVAVLPQDGSLVSSAQVTLEGDVAGAATLTVDSQPVNLIGGHFVAGPYTLAEGTRTWDLVAIDAAGNEAARTHRVVRDATAPVLTFGQPPQGAVRGASPIAVVGTVQDTHAVTVTVNGTAATITGTTWVVPNLPLAEGETLLAVEARDAAGNVANATRTVVLDTLPPALAITDPAQGTVVPGASIAVSGSVTDPHLDRVEVNGVRATVANGTWTAKVPLAEGNNSLVARAHDTLGQSAADTVAVLRDSQAPAIHIEAPEEGSWTSAATVAVSGTVEQEAGLTVTVNGGAATLTGGSFTAGAVALTEGENRLIARVVDHLGNQGAHTRLVYRDTVAPRFVASEPSGGALALPLEAVVELTFSEPLRTPLAAGSWRLETTAGQALPAGAAVSGSSVTIHPDAVLPSRTGIRLVLTAGLVDRAGNALAAPPTLTFTTADREAPPTPVLTGTTAAFTCGPQLALSGTAEPEAMVEVTGGAGVAQARADQNGAFSLLVDLRTETLNRLEIIARDRDGNRSAPVAVEVIHDCAGPRVTGADLAAGAFRVTFSEKIDPDTLIGAVKVFDGTGEIAGSLTAAAGDTGAFFAPTASPSGLLRLEVGTGVRDLAGNALAYPYSQVFGGDVTESFLSGRVIDNETGRPLTGAVVVVVASGGTVNPEPQPEQTTGADGRFSLPVAQGTHTLLVAKNGHTPSFRSATVLEDSGTDVFDPRLTPAPAPVTLPAAGGTWTGAGGLSLVIPNAALAAPAPVAVTALEEQGLPALLPYGWSPRGAAWVDLGGATLAAPATLTLPVDAPNGTSLALVRLDLNTLQWFVVDIDTVSGGRITLPVSAEGGWAAVEADAGVTAPPAPVVGVVLGSATAAGAASLTAASLAFNPATVLPSQRSVGTVTYTATDQSGLPSGIPLTLVIREELTLLDGSVRRPGPYEADLVVYRAPAGGLRSRFGLRPSVEAQSSPLQVGSEAVVIRTYASETVRGNVLGPQGGAVSNGDGDQVSVPAGGLLEPAAVSLTRRAVGDLPRAVPAGTAFLGLLDLGLSGRVLTASAQLTLDLGAAPAGTAGLLFQSVNLGSGPLWRPVASLEATPVGWTTATGDPDLRWPGVREGGVYLFAELTTPVGYLYGTVFGVDSAALAGALVSSPAVDWIQLARDGAETGRYVLPLPVGGELTVVAENRATADAVTVETEIASAGVKAALNLLIQLTGPRVLEVNPASGSTNVPSGIEPTVRFSEPVDPATVSAGILLYDGTTLIPVSLEAQGALVRVRPRSTLRPGVTHELRVNTALRDLQGHRLIQAVTATFVTLQPQISSQLDLKRVHLLEPVNGIARVVARSGAVPAGSTVIVERTTGAASTVTGTAAQDGTFELSIPATLKDTILLHVLRQGQNEILVELIPFLTTDGRAAYVDEAEAMIFTTLDGITVKIEEGTFLEPTVVRVTPRAVGTIKAPIPTGLPVVYSFDLDFGGVEAQKALQISVPTPAGTTGDDFLLSRIYTVFGQDYWMLYDLMRRNGGVITTELLPDELVAALGGPQAVAQLASMAPQIPDRSDSLRQITGASRRREGKRYVPGAANPGTYLVMDNVMMVDLIVAPLAFTASYILQPNLYGNATFIEAAVERLLAYDGVLIPTPAGLPFVLHLYDLLTGLRFHEQSFSPPEPGEITILKPDVFGDKTPPSPVRGSPIRLFPMVFTEDVSEDLSPVIHLEFQAAAQSGQGSLQITGDPGAAQKDVQILLFGVDDGAKVTTQSSQADGSFTLAGPITAGRRYLLAIGAVVIPGDHLEIGFSEALAEGFPGLDVLEAGRSIRPRIEPVGSAETVRIAPEYGWRAGKTYTLRLGKDLADVAGNAWDRQLDLQIRVQESRELDTFELANVRDVARLGSLLFVAAEDKGLVVLDASDPADLKNAVGGSGNVTFPFPLADPVMSVDVDPHGRVFVAGGGLSGFGQLKIFDVLAFDPEAIEQSPNDPAVRYAAFKGSTLLSDRLGVIDGTTLPEGRPYQVTVLSNDKTNRWRIGVDAPPEGVTLSPAEPPPGGGEYAVTVNGGIGLSGHPVTLRNATRGRWDRVDANFLNAFSVSVRVFPGDEVELLRNQSTIAYVVTRGVGIQVVDVDAFYNEDSGNPEPGSLQSNVIGTYTGNNDASLALCGQPVSDISSALIGVGKLFDPKVKAHPLTLVGLVGQRGLALFDSDPEDAGDISFFNEMCLNLGGSAQVSGLEIAEDYPFDKDGDGRFDPEEHRDYILVAHRTEGVLIVDAEDRDNLELVGWIKLAGGQAAHVNVDRQRRRLFVSGYGGGVYVLDFDRPLTTQPVDANQDTIDDRLLETIKVPDNVNVNSPVFLLPELGLAYTGGAGRGVTSLAVGGPRLTAITENRGPQPPPDGMAWRPIERLAPLGVPSAPESSAQGAREIPASFRILASLPGVTGEEARLDVTSVGPGGLPISGAGDADAIPDLPGIELTGDEDGILLHRLADNPWEEGYQLYLSEEIVTVADLRASRKYQRTPAEDATDSDSACRRCKAADLKIPEDAHEILSGHQVSIRLPAALRETLADTYDADRLDAAEITLASTPWDLSPALRQEPSANPSLGNGEVVPGTLLHSGEMTVTATDLFLKGAGIDFAFTRTYRSQAIGAGPLGPGWDHGYNLRLRELPDGDLDFFDGRGRREIFKKLPGGRYGSPTGRFVSLHRTAAGFVMIDRQHAVLRFDRFGRLVAIASSSKVSKETGTELELSYDLHSRLARVEAHGRELLLSYDEESGRLVKLSDFTGREVKYEYDTAGRLVKVISPKVTIGSSTFSNGLATTYTYTTGAGNLTGMLHSRDNLTSVSDPRNNKWLELTYTDADGDGRAQEVTTQKWGLPSVTLSYAFGERRTQVMDRRFHTWTYVHDEEGRPVQVKDPLQNTTSFEYSSGGALTRTTFPLGRQIVQELQANPDDDPRARLNLSRSRVIADTRGPNGSSAELVTEYLQYDGRTNTPTRVRDPRNLLRYSTLDDRGLPRTVIEGATSDDAGETVTEYNDRGQPTRVVNPNGHATTLEYYESPPREGFLRQVTVDPGGLDLQTVFEWDLRGYPSAVTDPRGVRHEYEHNELGWLVEERQGVSGADGVPLVSRYSYDANGNVQEVQTAAGDGGGSYSRTQYDYGTLNELEEVRSEMTPGAGDFAVTRYNYDLGLNRNHEEGPDGQVTQWTYDERNLPATMTRGVGEAYASTESYEHDAEGQLIARTDGAGKIWRTVYDGYGRPAQEIDPLGNVRMVTYDNNSNPASQRQFDGEQQLLAKMEMSYDARDRLAVERRFLWDPQAEEPETRELTRTHVYDPASNLTLVRDEKGAETRTFYDAAERQIAVQDALGNRIDLTLDGQGNATRSTDIQVLSGGTTVSETNRIFNPLGFPVQEVDPIGRTTQWIRDVRGNVRLLVDPSGLSTESLYDGLDRLVRVTQPDGTSEDFGYDASSRLISYRDALSQITQFVYDERDRLRELRYPDQTTESYSYDARDLRTRWERPNGTEIEETYDDAGRLTKRQVVQAEEIEGPMLETFAYDSLGRMIQATSGDVTTERHYDSLSQLLSETTAGRTVAYTYDDAGNRTGIQYPSGRMVEIQPDALGRPSTINVMLGATTRVPKVAYGYRGSALVASKTLGTTVAGTLLYDAAGQLFRSSFAGLSGHKIVEETLIWNSRGLKAAQSRGDLNNAALHFTYDGAARLTEARRRSGTSATSPISRTFQNLPDNFGFTYDRAHNLLAKVEERLCENEQVLLPLEASGRNRPAQVGGTALAWSANGNLETRGDLTFHYDWKDRLKRVTRGATEVASYTYDALNRRIAKEVSGQQIETVWDGWQAIEEYRGGVLRGRRVYGLGLDEIVSLEIDFDSDGTLTEHLPYYDSTSNLVAVTDSLGKVVERYEYSPFGERWAFVDATAPAIEQIRVKGDEVWFELSEEVLLEPLNNAVSAGTLTLARVDTGEALPIAITQPVGPGLSSPRRLVVKLTSEEESWPETGTLLQVTLPAAALVDLFGNVATSGAAESFAWKAGDVVLDDAVAPRVQRVCVSGGHLEIELSEEAKLADLATAIQVNGAPIAWNLAGGGYLLVSADVLPAGSYTLSIGTQSLDLVGLGLAESFQRSFTLSAGETRKQIYLRSLPGFASTSTIGNLFGFHGQPLDPETGLVYIRNRYYDPELGRFITTDPMGYGDGPNLYQYGLNNPANFSDPTGEYVESAWDLVSLGFGLASLANNIKEENYGGALLDIFGIAVDGIALAVPLVPGGAGAALKASRAAGFLGKMEFIDTSINMMQGAIQARDSFREGHYGWGTFYAGMSALGLKRGLESPFKVEVRGMGANLGNVRIVAREQGRDLKGRFLPKTGGELAPGADRANRVQRKLEARFGQGSVQSEQYLRMKDDSIAIDPVTKEARRLDLVVISGGKPRYSVEVTSHGASKTAQALKETRIRSAGGVYVRDRVTGQLVDLSQVSTRIVRVR